MASKFGVSLRTIYRDIRKLEEAGVPIITEEGKGYSIMEGYTVSPVKFQQEEVNALITAEKMIAKSGNDSLIKNFGKALTKIKSTFRSEEQSKGELLEAKMHVFANSKTAIQTKSLSTIQLAMTNLHQMKIKYQKVNAEEISERSIDPAAIFCYDSIWMVVAWCHLRNDYRTFRLDRILEYQLTSIQFQDRDFNLRKYFMSRPHAPQEKFDP